MQDAHARGVPRVEWMRKLVHIPGGLLAPLFILAFGWGGAVAISLFLLAYLALAWDAARRGVILPIVGAGILETTRPGERAPVGALEFLASVSLLGILFPLPYFLGAVALLAAGDGAAALAGRAWGRRRLPWNPDKSWAGLAAGVVVGVTFYVAFAVAGAFLTLDGYDRLHGLFGKGGTWTSLAFLVLGFPLVHVLVALGARATKTPRKANASAATVVWMFIVALAPALAFLLTGPLLLDGPLLPLLGGHDEATRRLLWLVPAATMVVESFLRGHDNAVLPALSCLLAYGVVGLGAA